MVRIVVNGAGGRMGSEVVRTAMEEKDITVIGGVDPSHGGEDLGTLCHLKPMGIQTASSLDEVLQGEKPDVIVDFTNPKVIFSNAKKILGQGIHMVIGTTGLTADNRSELEKICKKTGAHGLIAPNFSLTAVLLMEAAAKISKYLPNVEIIELHHNHKFDAPSGTALLTAEKIAKSRTLKPDEDHTKESLPGVRGGKCNGIPIHSVRLPGYVAHEEVLFGGYGETLTIRQDSLDRKCFMPGVMLACKKVAEIPGLVYGLENYLD